MSQVIAIVLISIIFLIFLIATITASICNMSEYEKRIEDMEQQEYLEKWKREHHWEAVNRRKK